jgi:hypothetical protein
MNNSIIRNIFIGLLIAGASVAYGAIPPITVLVADSSGKAAYKGTTDSKGTFATTKLQAGHYVVQFNSTSGNIKGQSYALFISAGKKKVQADSVAGEKFAAGGVAMKIDVAAGLNITGQVTTGLQTKVDKNGKKMVWIPQKLGSNLPGHWAAEDSAEAKEAMASTSMSRQDLQNRQNQSISPGQ